MEEREFKERATRLEQIAKVLDKLPTEIRSASFELLKGYVTGDPHKGSDGSRSKPQSAGSDEDDAQFFAKFSHDKPADNARLIAANFYRKFGSEPFSVDEVRQCAKDVGITIPERVDMTLDAARESGKLLFARAGRGKFKPTVHGEAALKASYQVNKGRMRKPAATE